MKFYDPKYDLNKDGRIDEADEQIFLAAYKSSAGDANWNPACDFDRSGRVDSGDMAMFLEYIGTSATGEPVTLPGEQEYKEYVSQQEEIPIYATGYRRTLIPEITREIPTATRRMVVEVDPTILTFISTEDQLKAMGVTVETSYKNLIQVLATSAQIAAIEAWQQVKHVREPMYAEEASEVILPGEQEYKEYQEAQRAKEEIPKAGFNIGWLILGVIVLFVLSRR